MRHGSACNALKNFKRAVAARAGCSLSRVFQNMRYAPVLLRTFSASIARPTSHWQTHRASTLVSRLQTRTSTLSDGYAFRRHFATEGLPVRRPSRLIKYTRRLAYLGLGLTAAYLTDAQFFASSGTRSLRTFATGAIVASDYKLNFRAHPWTGGTIEDLHARNAERIYQLLCTNGGLYLKIGQAIAMQSAILPLQFQKRFAKMYDDAPQNDWRDAERVIREDFGKSPEEVFGVSFEGAVPGKGVMERVARASASVAQVHWARLGDGREVAIKIQKREIAQQVGWDLWTFKSVFLVSFPRMDRLLTPCLGSSCTSTRPFSISLSTIWSPTYPNDSY